MFVAIERPKLLIKPPGLADPQDAPLPGGGYVTIRRYMAQGLCLGQGFLQGYMLSEGFSNINNGSTNWPLNAEGLALSSTSNLWADTISAQVGNFCGPTQNQTCDPAPTVPGNPPSITVRQSASQVWQIGSTNPGDGIVVQRNTLQRFIDHGDHANIMSPTN
ncbi:MAG: hypothetical protein U5J83_09660 [Bryobacterales bacterium]|nr:hypothetical protein [Bryobacterales bacterium]